jgi:hypothetical protein
VRICRGLGPGWHLATSLLNLAQPTMHLGDLAEAEALLTEARRLYRDLGDRLFEARAVEYLGFVALLGGDTGRAGRLLAASLKGFRHIGDPGGVAEALAGLAAVEAAVGNALAAARIAAASDELRASEGARPLPFERAITEPLVEKARRAETADAWAAAWEEGAELGPDGVVGLAGAVSGAGPTPRRGARPS